MTENNNPATPPQGATPGDTTSVITTPPTVTPQVVPEGKVTISTKEFAQLQRDAARGKSAQRRSALGLDKPNATIDESDPAAAAIAQANNRAAEAERKAMQMEVNAKVADLLNKDEFKALPKSTRAVILKNPALLSQADNLEEAMLDIEDFVRDQVLSLENGGATVIPGMGGEGKTAVPATPPVVNSGGPAPVAAVGLEDLSKLSGPARSQAAIRNQMKTARGVK